MTQNSQLPLIVVHELSINDLTLDELEAWLEWKSRSRIFLNPQAE